MDPTKEKITSQNQDHGNPSNRKVKDSFGEEVVKTMKEGKI